MAFADLMLRGIYLPSFIFSWWLLKTSHHMKDLFSSKSPSRFSHWLRLYITAALISAERFYAIYWPLKHRTLSTRAYRLVILLVWTMAILFSTVYVLLFWSPMALYSFLCLYVLFLALTICVLNIGIWRKFKQKTPSHQKKRAFQQQRLTKALSYVSVFTLISWIPISIYSLIIGSFAYKIHVHILLLTLFMYLSSSFINPVVYAIRIPEFKQALPNVCCFRRRALKDFIWPQPTKVMPNSLSNRKLYMEVKTQNCDQQSKFYPQKLFTLWAKWPFQTACDFRWSTGTKSSVQESRTRCIV